LTVLQIEVTTPKPGRLVDRRELMNADAVEVILDLGASGFRLLNARIAGTAITTSVAVLEFPSYEALGRYNDNLLASPIADAMLDQLHSDTSPIVVDQMMVATEIPLDRVGAPGRGAVVLARVARAVPGRLDDALELTRKGFELLEAHGAVGCRLVGLDAAGALTDCLAMSWEFESMAALGRAIEAARRDPTGIELAAIAGGAVAGPLTPVSSGIFVDVPFSRPPRDALDG
jgi:hypothetical protein